MQVVKPAERKNMKKGAGRVIASAENDVTIPYFTDVFYNQDPTLLARGHGKGLKLYDEIERDTFAWSNIQKRKTTLVEREWEMTTTGKSDYDQDASAFAKEQIEALPFNDICESLLDATLKGFAISEIVWERNGDRILPLEIKSHEQRRFMFDKDWKPRLLTWTNNHNGDELPDRKFMVHRHGVKGNNPYGLGMGTRLFFPVMFKREGVTFWLKFLEKFASPTIVGKTPYGTLENEQNGLLKTLSRFHSDGAITVPVDVDVELLEAKRGGSMSGLEWCNYWDKQMSIAMLGETLTTDLGSVGSRAAAEVHSGVLDKLVNSDSDLLADTLQSQFITWLVEYNYPGAVIPRLSWKRPKDEKAEAETDKAKAEAAIAHNEAMRDKLAFVADIDKDDVARSILMASGLVDDFDNDMVDALIEVRKNFKVAAPEAPPLGHNGGPALDDEEASFAAISFKKKR